MEFYIVLADGVNTTNLSDQSFDLMTYSPYIEHSPGKFAVYMFFAATFSILGVFGNILAIMSVFREKVLRVPENMFIVSLAGADIMVAGFVLPFGIAGVVLGEGYFYHRVKTCEFLASVCWIACLSAFLSITGLALNRMILVCFPKLYARIFKWKTTPFIAFLPWFIAFLSLVPQFTDWSKLEYDPESMMCLSDLDYLPNNLYLFVFVFISLMTIFIAIVLTVVKIYSIKGKKHEFSVIAPNVLLMGSFLPSDEEEHLHKAVDEKSDELGKYLENIMITMKTLFCLFLACLIWTPFTVGLLSHHIVNYGRDYWAFANLLGHMQPGVDCICYLIANKYFRTGYKNSISMMFCCRTGKKN